LTDDAIPALRIQVLDADTDAVLYTTRRARARTRSNRTGRSFGDSHLLDRDRARTGCRRPVRAAPAGPPRGPRRELARGLAGLSALDAQTMQASALAQLRPRVAARASLAASSRWQRNTDDWHAIARLATTVPLHRWAIRTAVFASDRGTGL
jgi:hypothetical protein